MNALLKPAVLLLGRIRVQYKLLLLAIVFLGAIAVSTSLLLRRVNSELEFTRQETIITALIAPARRAAQAVQEHRGLTQGVLSGNMAMAAKQQEARERADAAFAAGDALMRTAIATQDISEVWKRARQAWEAARDKAGKSSAEDSFAAHTEAVSELLAYLDACADASNASLDPYLATYNLASIVTTTAPKLAEHFAQGRARATVLAGHKQSSEMERSELNLQFVLMNADQDALKASVGKLLRAEPSYQSRLGDPLGVIEKARDTFHQQVTLLLHRDEKDTAAAPVDAVAVFENSSRAVNSAYLIMDEAAKAFDQDIATRIAHIEHERAVILGVIAFCILVALYLLLAFRQITVSALLAIDRGLQRIAQGDLSDPIHVAVRDEFGDIAQALNRMRIQLKERHESEAKIAAENQRIRNALDKASTNIMLADNDGVILYCNESVLVMFNAAESDIRKQLPNFRSQGLVGRNFDEFHANPAHQRNMLGRLTTVHRAQIEVGGRHFRLTANPVVNPQGERLGSVVEWLDRTAEVLAEREISKLVGAAAIGDFSERISTQNKSGFFLQVSEGMNGLVDVVAHGLEDVAKVLNAIAQGDLTQKIDTQYVGMFGRLKEDTNKTVDRLRDVINQIKEASDAVTGAAQEIAAGNSDLSSRTEEQAGSLEETSSSMEELNSTVRQNADNAVRANDLARESNEAAQRGGQMVSRVVEMMSSIQESARKIADIIGVIDSIAFQTNILALNAAVEAARAGEQGRGFAVVASEVRSLAQRSAQAAKEIKTLIADSVEKVESGAHLVNDTGKAMTEVVDNFVGLAHIVTEIAQASREQSSGIEQVTGAVSQMDDMTQQNAALVEQAAAAAESLEEQARALTQAVAMFNTGSGASPVKMAPSASRTVLGAPARSPGRSVDRPVRAAKSTAPRAALPSGKPKASATVVKRSAADEDEWEEF